VSGNKVYSFKIRIGLALNVEYNCVMKDSEHEEWLKDQKMKKELEASKIINRIARSRARAKSEENEDEYEERKKKEAGEEELKKKKLAAEEEGEGADPEEADTGSDDNN
jgi:hypothetical protein